jgi:hypothetical protein
VPVSTPQQDAVAIAEATMGPKAETAATPVEVPESKPAPAAMPAAPVQTASAPAPIATSTPAPPVATVVAPAGDVPMFPAENVPVETAAFQPGTKTAFFDTLSGYCEVTLLLNEAGEVLKHTANAPTWTALSKEIAEDALRWVKNTSSLLPPKQLVVMRSQLSHSHSVCFFMDGNLITFGVINSVAIGRLFIAANEFMV